MPRSACLFLDLPAELRLQIYSYVLVPTGTLFLTRTNTRRFAVSPQIPVAVLRANRQVYRESVAFLYKANEITVSIDAHDTSWPVVAETRLPQRILEKLEHVFIVLDCTQPFYARYTDVDFTAFEAMTSLRTLRLAVIYDEGSAAAAPRRICQSQAAHGSDAEDLVTEILMRVPMHIDVLCDVDDRMPQMEHVELVLENRRRSKGKNTEMVRLMDPCHVKAATDAVLHHVRGSKSGGNDDVFAHYHEENSKRACMWRQIYKKTVVA